MCHTEIGHTCVFRETHPVYNAKDNITTTKLVAPYGFKLLRTQRGNTITSNNLNSVFSKKKNNNLRCQATFHSLQPKYTVGAFYPL